MSQLAANQKVQAALAMHKAGQLQQAERLYREALKSDPKNVNALNLLGKLAMQVGRFADAKPLIERACALAPNIAQIQDSLVDFHLKTNRPGKALEVMQRIVRLAPTDPARWVQLGTLLTAEGRWDESLAAYDKALELDPTYAKAGAGKAMNYERRGMNEDAARTLEPFLTEAAPHPEVLGIYGTVCAKVGQAERGIEMLRAGVQRQDIHPDHRSVLWFGLADLYAGQKRHDEAFHAYTQAQQLRQVPWQRESTQRIHALITECYSAAAAPKLVRSTQTTAQPVFVLGMPRSGTSLVEQTIACHPNAAGAGELSGISDAAIRLQEATGGREIYPRYLPRLTPGILDKAAADYLELLRRVAGAPDAQRLTDKAPSNFMYIGLIAQLFPNARIIHCTRHPLDSCISCFTKRFTFGHGFTRSLEDLASYYCLYDKLVKHFKSLDLIPILDVSYEAMVADHEGQTRRILDFIGLDFDPACLRFYESDRDVLTASYEQVRKPVYNSSVARWKRYEKHLGPLIAALRAGGVEVDLGGSSAG